MARVAHMFRPCTFAAITLSLLCALSLPSAVALDYLRNETGFILYLRQDDGAEYRQVPPLGLLPVRGDLALEGFAYDRGSFQLSTVELAPDEP